jgi:hypothetical protein
MKELKSIEELTRLLEKYSKDIESVCEKQIKISPEMCIIKLKIEGNKYDATITTSIMEYIINLQKGIYDIYRQYNNGQISASEKKDLEITVKVEKGCSDIIFSIFEQLEAIKILAEKMTGNQIFAVIIEGIVAFTAISITKKIFDHKSEKLKQDAETQRLKIQADAVNTATKNAAEEKERFLIMFENTIGISQTAREKTLKNLKNIGEENRIQINGEDVTHKSLIERTKNEKQKNSKEVSTITGKFRITKMTLDFNKETAKADIFNIDTGDPIFGLELQPKSIYDGSYKVLKQAKDKNDVELQIIVTKKKDTITKAVLDKVL